MNDHADVRSNQLSLGQVLLFVALGSIPLICLMNYHSNVVSTTSGYVTPLRNAPGFAFLWLGAATLAACAAAAYLCYRRRWIALGTYALLLLTPIAFIASGYVSPDRAVNPEVTRNTEAMNIAIGATTQFLAANQNQWPESWSDLRNLIPEDDFELTRSRVDFNFGADPETLANQSWHEFSGVLPHRPYLNTYRDELSTLLGQLNRTSRSQASTTNGS